MANEPVRRYRIAVCPPNTVGCWQTLDLVDRLTWRLVTPVRAGEPFLVPPDPGRGTSYDWGFNFVLCDLKGDPMLLLGNFEWGKARPRTYGEGETYSGTKFLFYVDDESPSPLPGPPVFRTRPLTAAGRPPVLVGVSG